MRRVSAPVSFSRSATHDGAEAEVLGDPPDGLAVDATAGRDDHVARLGVTASSAMVGTARAAAP